MEKKLMDIRLLKYILLFYTLAFVLSATSAFIAKWEGVAYSSFGYSELMGNHMIRYVSKFVFIYGAVILIRYLVEFKKVSRWIGVLSHVCFGVGLTFYSIYSQVLLNNWLYGAQDPTSFEYVYQRALLGTDYNFFLYFSVVTIVYAYYFFKKQKDYEVFQSSLKSQLLDAKMNALQTQLQPHFLFNTLNDIVSLVEHNPEKAQDAIADLSEMLRQTLQLQDTRFISFQDELKLLQKYLDIEKIRYEDKLNFDINISPDVLQRDIPPLLFQPIVENSIKHGFSLDIDHLHLKLQAKQSEDFLLIEVVNDGAPLKDGQVSFGVGIGNLISRLDTLYGENFDFDMRNRKNLNGVITRIRLPIQF
ncbi:MAG: histidine kinase [Bacteroidota bacterium]